MRTCKIFVESGSILLLSLGFALGSWFRPHLPTSRELLQAPVVTVATVDSVEPEWQMPAMQRIASPPVIFTAALKTDAVLRGSLPGDALTVPFARDNSLWMSKRLLVPSRRYVLFLSAPEGQGLCRGIDKYEFALPIETLPAVDAKALGTTETLRAIAKANIAATSETIAARWCDFLGGMYREEDQAVFTELAYTDLSAGAVYQDMSFERVAEERWHLRGTALAVLCENTVLTSATYGQALGFLRRFWTGPSLTEHWDLASGLDIGTVSRRIEAVLRQDAKAVPPPVERLRDWLASGVKVLEYLALEVASEKRRVDILPEALDCMQRTIDPRLCYESWATVTTIDGVPGPGLDEFLHDPKKYMGEALARHPEAARTPK